MKRWILGLVTVAAVSLVGGTTASAQGYGDHGNRNSHGGYRAGYGNQSPAHHGTGHGGYGAVYGGYNRNSGGSWGHGRSHLDYHPGSFQLHRFHFDYVPSHYDAHRSGPRH